MPETRRGTVKGSRKRRPTGSVGHSATRPPGSSLRRGCDCLESPAVQALGHCMSPHAHRSFLPFKVIHGAWTVFDTLRIGIPRLLRDRVVRGARRPASSRLCRAFAQGGRIPPRPPRALAARCGTGALRRPLVLGSAASALTVTHSLQFTQGGRGGISISGFAPIPHSLSHTLISN